MLKLAIPKEEYVASIDILKDRLEIQTKKRKKVAMVMVCLGENYWPYLAQCLDDARKHFLPNHHTDYFIWTDFSQDKVKESLDYWKGIPKRYEEATNKEELMAEVIRKTAELLRNQQVFNPELIQQQFVNLNNNGVFLTKEGQNYNLRTTVDFAIAAKLLSETGLIVSLDNFQRIAQSLKKVNLIETDPAPWPMPTLMRYHLFLQREEELQDYDYIFYLDSDSRIVNSIPDEIMGEGLTCAPHPGYVINPRYLPPYEPNKDSAAYIHRLHYFQDEGGKKRLIPFYAAGGFQGGKTNLFLKAMHEMKASIDADFNLNYTAIWNDESHWNKLLWEYQKAGGQITFCDVSYVMPDSLIKEYYEPLWGRSYEPKIVSLTKPWTLVPLGPSTSNLITKCPTCGDTFQEPNIISVVECHGTGKQHKVNQKVGL